MISLSPKQAELLSFIRHYMLESGGIAPTRREMMLATGCRGYQRTQERLEALEDYGFIRRLHGRARALEVIPQLALIHDRNHFEQRAAEKRAEYAAEKMAA